VIENISEKLMQLPPVGAAAPNLFMDGEMTRADFFRLPDAR
jgi:hypothetical protein